MKRGKTIWEIVGINESKDEEVESEKTRIKLMWERGKMQVTGATPSRGDRRERE